MLTSLHAGVACRLNLDNLTGTGSEMLMSHFKGLVSVSLV
jgi:hypothetical protein